LGGRLIDDDAAVCSGFHQGGELVAEVAEQRDELRFGGARFVGVEQCVVGGFGDARVDQRSSLLLGQRDHFGEDGSEGSEVGVGLGLLPRAERTALNFGHTAG
jgi:hypothetical protein